MIDSPSLASHQGDNLTGLRKPYTSFGLLIPEVASATQLPQSAPAEPGCTSQPSVLCPRTVCYGFRLTSADLCWEPPHGGSTLSPSETSRYYHCQHWSPCQPCHLGVRVQSQEGQKGLRKGKLSYCHKNISHFFSLTIKIAYLFLPV